MKFDSVWLFPERDNNFQKELKFVLAWFFSNNARKQTLKMTELATDTLNKIIKYLEITFVAQHLLKFIYHNIFEKSSVINEVKN